MPLIAPVYGFEVPIVIFRHDLVAGNLLGENF